MKTTEKQIKVRTTGGRPYIIREIEHWINVLKPIGEKWEKSHETLETTCGRPVRRVESGKFEVLATGEIAEPLTD